jgi:hypothetical protein
MKRSQRRKLQRSRRSRRRKLRRSRRFRTVQTTVLTRNAEFGNPIKLVLIGLNDHSGNELTEIMPMLDKEEVTKIIIESDPDNTSKYCTQDGCVSQKKIFKLLRDNPRGKQIVQGDYRSRVLTPDLQFRVYYPAAGLSGLHLVKRLQDLVGTPPSLDSYISPTALKGILSSELSMSDQKRLQKVYENLRKHLSKLFEELQTKKWQAYTHPIPDTAELHTVQKILSYITDYTMIYQALNQNPSSNATAIMVGSAHCENMKKYLKYLNFK